MIREIKVWNVRCTAETSRLLIISWPEMSMKYGVIKLAELCTACFVKDDLQAILPSARQT